MPAPGHPQRHCLPVPSSSLQIPLDLHRPYMPLAAGQFCCPCIHHFPHHETDEAELLYGCLYVSSSPGRSLSLSPLCSPFLVLSISAVASQM